MDGKGPFYAIEAQPLHVNVPSSAILLTSISITITYGRIAIDTEGHALTPDNSIIPGLLAAGVDAGGFRNLGYAGGLALAFLTGFWAAQEAAKQLGLRSPSPSSSDSRDGEDEPIQGHL